MTDDANDANARPAKPGARERAEADLDCLLDLVEPPQPSETLRARLKRDFAPGAPAADGGNGRRGGASVLRERAGAIAVAAALVLAVALGNLMLPRGGGAPDAAADAAVVAAADIGDIVDSDDIADLRQTLAESPPDSAAFMVAALALAVNADGPAPDGTEPFEGLPLD